MTADRAFAAFVRSPIARSRSRVRDFWAWGGMGGGLAGGAAPPRTPLRPGGCAPEPEKKHFFQDLSWEALVAIFGIYVKKAAQPWGRELRSSIVALFPSRPKFAIKTCVRHGRPPNLRSECVRCAFGLL